MPEHSQRSWDQQLHYCKNIHTALFAWYRALTGGRGGGKERRGEEKERREERRAERTGEGKGGSRMDAVQVDFFLFLAGT